MSAPREKSLRVPPRTAARLLMLLLCLCVCALCAASPGHAASSAAAPHTLSAALYRTAGLADSPGSDLILALTFTPEPGYYSYASPSQTDGRPTRVSVADAANRAVSPFILYPAGVEREDAYAPGGRTRVYPGPVTIAVPLSGDRHAGQTLFVRYEGLLCSAVNCAPFSLTLEPSVPERDGLALLPEAELQPWWSAVAKGPREPNTPPLPSAQAGDSGERAIPLLSPDALLQAEAEAPPVFFHELAPRFFMSSLEVTSLTKALALGFLAGLLLNIMPCVLPVLGLKLSALLAASASASEADRRRVFVRHNLFFSLGILTWFAALAGLLAGLDLLWGQLFQQSGLILGLSILLLLLACNLLGVFSLPILDLKGGPSSRPDLSAFMGGATATLLATPCSGPLLGGVLSWSLFQTPPVLALALFSVGLGMAGPYLLLAARPRLVRYMPRPGPWMAVVEQLLAFLLLAAAVYLVTLLPPERLPKALGALLLAGFAAWLWGRIGGVRASRGRRFLARLLAAALLVAACVWPLKATLPRFVWQPFEEKAVSAAFGKTPLFVEFTADWCPTCRLMEATTLTPRRMEAWQKRYGFTAVRVDLSRDNPEGQDLLRRLGSASIPLLALFPVGETARSPLVLRDVVTPGQLEEALRRTFAKQ